MSEDLGAAALTAAVSAFIGLIGQLPWSEIGPRVRRALTRRGRGADPELEQALVEGVDAPGTGDEDGTTGGCEQARRLAELLAGLPSPDQEAVRQELAAPVNHTEITVNGGKTAIHNGRGDMHVDFR